MPQLFLNNFQTQFIASVKAAPDSSSPALELDYGVLRVSDGAAGLLLNPGAGNWYVLTAFKRSGSAESDYEVVHVTAVDNAVLGECRLTVLRGQEGTTPKSYVAGDIMELRLTAGGMRQYVQTTDTRLSNSRAPTGGAGGVLSGSYPNPGFAQAMATAADLVGKVDKVAGKGLSANDYSNADLAKLNGVAEQATKNSTDAQLRDRASHTGAQAIGTVTGLQAALDAKAPSSHVASGGAAHAAATNVAAGFMSAADKVKLDSVAAAATANSADATLLSRANHTGTQSITTIDGLQAVLGEKVDVVAGKGLSSTDFTAEEKAKLGGIAASATANASDATLRARVNHTGTQAISTVTDLQTTLDGKQATLVSGVNIKTINGEAITGAGNIVVDAAVDAVRRPVNISPADAATGILESPTLVGSTYLSLYGLAMSAAQFQLSTAADFSTTVVSTGDVAGTGTSYTVGPEIISVSTTYYWRVRYKNAEGIYSAWSAPTSFTAAASLDSYIATPTPTPAAFGDPFEGGFYAGMIWNEVAQSSGFMTIGTGEKTFTVPSMAGAPIVYAGQQLEVRLGSNPDYKMIGTVTSAIGTRLKLNITSASGSGTFGSWMIMSRYRVIVAPKASGENSPIAYGTVPAPSSAFTLTDGRKNTLTLVAFGGATSFPAAHWCNNLNIGGKTDWYLPARDELELCWRNLKPNSSSNYVTSDRPIGTYVGGSYPDTEAKNGLNRNSDPNGAAYTSSVPAQTAAVDFRAGGVEAFSSAYFWSSGYYDSTTSWRQRFATSTPGAQTVNDRTASSGHAVRAVRRSII